MNVFQIDGNGNVAAASFSGNGAGLTNVSPAAGSPNYIRNGTTAQAAANFNISGNGTIGGNLALPNTTSVSVGVLTLGGAPFLHNFGSTNTFVGASAGNMNLTGGGNSAFGFLTLNANTTGGANSAFGDAALRSNTTGQVNAAFGASALNANTIGQFNSAFGANALQSNTTGNNNNALGFIALKANATGNNNNNAFGTSALQNLTSGSSNIAIGQNAGSNLTAAESNDIYIGNTGVAGESNIIRIGDPAVQTATFLAGISGATSASGVAVLVNPSGQLGTVTSSRRFKYEIVDMGGESDLLMKLRPVAFYYKPELETQTRQYGLVAEEVAQVAPQLVVFDKDGAPQTVRYHFVNAMLLNEVQKQRTIIVSQESKNQDLEARLAKLEAVIAGR